MADNPMVQYIADALSSQLADANDTSDFVLQVDGDDIAYVDVENAAVWLITVKAAKLVPA